MKKRLKLLMMSSLLLALFLGQIMMASATTTGASNGGFESGSGTNATYWDQEGGSERTSADKRSGSYSLYANVLDWEIENLTPDFSVDDLDYIVIWIKATGANGKVGFGVRYAEPETAFFTFFYPTTGWGAFYIDGTLLANGRTVTSISLYSFYYGSSTGAYFDDILFVQILPCPNPPLCPN